MSGSTRSRQKRKLEPISLEELAGTTGMSGFCTFLTRNASVPVPVLDRLDAESPAEPEALSQSGAPVLPAPVLPAPDIGASVSAARVGAAPAPTAPVSSAPSQRHTPAQPRIIGSPNQAANQLAGVSAAPEITAPESSAPEFDAPDFTRRRIRIREALTVQDGHSLAEQAVYDAMYRAGKPYQGDSRTLTIGLRTLAELSRMAYSNCKANVRSLVAKLAIDEQEGFSYTEGRTYVIYSFREILRRRRAAGLTHVVRTRGVVFVDPRTGGRLQESSALDSSASYPVQGAPDASRAGAPATPQSSALPAHAQLRNRHFIRNPEEDSSSSLSAIVAALHRHVPDVDDDAASDLWRRCRDNAPDARVEEVVHFIHLKAGKPGIRIPLGFLLTAVPKCFKGDSYRQFRAAREQASEARLARDRMFATEILKSPEADEEQKEWAREVLGDASAEP